MKYTVHYLAPYAIEGDVDKYYGSYIKHNTFKDGQYYKPPSQAWVCPICAEVFMQVTVSNVGRYVILCNECEYCGEDDLLLAKTRITLPGSILMEGYNTIDELSMEMLRRELLLELKAIKLLIDKGVL